MSSHEVKLGEFIHGDASRDAVHVAVLPVIADGSYKPGTPVGFSPGSSEEVRGAGVMLVGIIDPFLKRSVKSGERCWMFLFPNTVTGMRHCWSHPDVPDETPVAVCRTDGVPYAISIVAERMGKSVEKMLEIADRYAETGESFFNGDDKSYNDFSWDEFWNAYRFYRNAPDVVTGGAPFRCAC